MPADGLMMGGEQGQLPPSLTDYAAEKIRDAIIEGTIALGAKLSEKDLSVTLGISKTPVREALLRLKTEGLVEIRPRIGTFVFDLKRSDIERIGEYRRILEASAIELAMMRNGVSLAARLRESVAKMGDLIDRGMARDYVREDAAFHQIVFESCGNDYVIDGYRSISSKVQAIRNRLSQDRQTLDESFFDHRQILAAVEMGDVAEAKACTVKHTAIHQDVSEWMYETYLKTTAK